MIDEFTISHTSFFSLNLHFHFVSFLKLNIYLSIYFDERQKEISHLYIYHANIYYGQKLENQDNQGDYDANIYYGQKLENQDNQGDSHYGYKEDCYQETIKEIAKTYPTAILI